MPFLVPFFFFMEASSQTPGLAALDYVSSSAAPYILLTKIQLSRPQVVKKIWEYIKERDLQVPEDKRQIRCDEKMQAVFKQDKVHMFTMNKILGKQLYDVEE
jgi:chromatin remodeling complex protein RSC6